MSIRFEIRGEYIQLDQLLKATDLASSGGEAHSLITDGAVWVDGQVELRKRAKLRPGQRVNFENTEIELVAQEASVPPPA